MSSKKKNINLFSIFFRNYFESISLSFRYKWHQFLDNWIVILGVSIWWGLFVFNKRYYDLSQYFPIEIFRPPLLKASKAIPSWVIFWCGYSFILSLTLFLFGYKFFKRKKELQNSLDDLGLKSGRGNSPQVIDVTDLSENRTFVLLNSNGVGLNHYKASKRDDFSTSSGHRVESMEYREEDMTKIELYLAKNRLDKMIKYEDVMDKNIEPFSFVLGKSHSGLLKQSIVDLPHLMIAGTTGAGKSYAVKNVLLGLLDSSEKLQMYIIDFKQVDLTTFQDLPNCEIITEKDDALKCLQKIERLMEKRYKKLREMKQTKIDPKRDGMNRIVITLDECKDLLGKVMRSDPDYPLVMQSRKLIDKIARKGRASGIHLILCTQKLDQTSIDTGIQENLGGRIALRTKTPENSRRMLGNESASKLPPIPGRAIWDDGRKCIEIQSPFVSDNVLQSRISEIISSKKFSDIKVSRTEVESKRMVKKDEIVD